MLIIRILVREAALDGTPNLTKNIKVAKDQKVLGVKKETDEVLFSGAPEVPNPLEDLARARDPRPVSVPVAIVDTTPQLEDGAQPGRRDASHSALGTPVPRGETAQSVQTVAAHQPSGNPGDRLAP